MKAPLLGFLLSLAAPATAAPIVACAISGWSADATPRGLNVRAAPSPRARVLDRLPPFVSDDDGDYGPGFRITGSSGGWLRIEDARDVWGPGQPRPTFAGRGWVHGSLVRVAVQSRQGRGEPLSRAPVVVDTGDAMLSEVGRVTGVHDCRGRLAQVSYRVDPSAKVRGRRSGRAWFGGICGEQRTTCDMSEFRWRP